MPACLSDDNFPKRGRMEVHFRTCSVSPGNAGQDRIYEGHRVKFKVTGAKKVENSYFHNSAIISKKVTCELLYAIILEWLDDLLLVSGISNER